MIISGIMSLLFPDICSACHRALTEEERHLCIECRINLPRTNFHKFSDNPVSRLFYGRVHLTAATSLYYFKKQSKVQNLVHGLKYKSREQLSVQLGQIMGTELKESSSYENEVVIPVPLHKNKLKSRGYNQSEGFATGIGNIAGSLVLPSGIERITETSTQTRKSREERWSNVKDVFTIREPDLVYGRKILVVDDVVTTGATLEACCSVLLKAGASAVSVATIAYAEI